MFSGSFYCFKFLVLASQFAYASQLHCPAPFRPPSYGYPSGRPGRHFRTMGHFKQREFLFHCRIKKQQSSGWGKKIRGGPYSYFTFCVLPGGGRHHTSSGFMPSRGLSGPCSHQKPPERDLDAEKGKGYFTLTFPYCTSCLGCAPFLQLLISFPSSQPNS